MRRIFVGMLLLQLLSGSVLCVAPSAAKQLQFEKKDKGEKVSFHYIYQDSVQRSQRLDFALAPSAIADSEALLLSNTALERAANDFALQEGQAVAARYLAAEQTTFAVGVATLQSAIATFNGRLGGRIVSLTLKKLQKLELSAEFSGEQLLDLKVSSFVPGMNFGRDTQPLRTKLYADTEAIVAQANANLPQGLKFSVVKKGGGIQFPLKNEKRTYDEGTRARAKQTVSATNARLRTRLNRYKQDLSEVEKFAEGTKERARMLIEKTYKRLAQTRKQVIADMQAKKASFYAAHYLLPSKKNDARAYIDYARIAQQAQPRLRPIAHAFRKSAKGKDERARVAEVLHFFQSIPYNDLTKGKVRGFRGFSPPLELIAQNLGDCDSKSTAMMGILRLLDAKRSVAIFLVPGHAFLGVEMETREGDSVHIHDGKTYVLMEPTGPRVRPLGSLLPSSLEHLKAGRIDDIVTLSVH